MTALFDPAPWWLVLLGWSVIVALWHTSVAGLGLASWRLWRREADARAQYAAASGALVLATVLTVATPLALLAQRRAESPAFRVVPGAGLAGAVQADPATPGAHPAGPAASGIGRKSVGVAAARLVPWIGAAWVLGFLFALARFCGGWALAQWIRRRATAVGSPAIADAALAASERWALPPAVLLASAHVDAPVVVGARAPVVLLPIGLEHDVAADALSPLLAHELAHVRRHDYAANLVQSFADALLWFSPAARWMSRLVREAREYCCDDVVTQRCGASAYARALTALAGLGMTARAKPAVNAVGPRLIVRIRRLLKEDALPPSLALRLAVIAGALLLVTAVAPAVLTLSAAGVHAVRVDAQRVAEADPVMPVAVSFSPQQPGSPVVIEAMLPTAGGMCGVATLHNTAAVAVRGVFFAAAFTREGSGGLALSERRATTIQPGTRAKVAVNFMSANEALSTGGTGPVKVVCSLAVVEFADGTTWSIGRDSGASPISAGGTTAPSESRTVEKVDIPIGFLTSQPGAALRLRDIQRTEGGLCGIAEIENLANVSITGVRFAAFAHAPPLFPRSSLFLASFATSELVAADVAPQQIATVDVGLLTRAEARERLRTPHATIMCAVAEIRYANGARWEMPPATVFGPERTEIPRALLGGDPVTAAPTCRDQNGVEYSEGAVVPIALEPGAFAICHEGAWSEHQLPRTPPDAAR